MLLAAVALAVFEGDLLYKLQEQNLFMHTPLFFQQRMVVAGGLLTWAGSYLTQFFYYPMLGAGLLCLLWAFFMFLLGRAFRVGKAWFPLTLVPVACLLLNITDLGYWVYYLKLPGHAFVATLGSIVAVVLAWHYSLLSKRPLSVRLLFILLSASLGYPLFGFYALWGVVLMAVIALRGKAARWPADVAMAVLAVIAVPLVCYQYVFHETNIVNIYWAALPVYARPEGSFPAYSLPYVVLVVSVLLFALRPVVKVGQWLQSLVLTLTAAFVLMFWYRDDNFHRELSMSRSIWEAQWDEVLSTAKATKGEPTRLVCIMKNLALTRLHRQPQEAVQYPEGARRPNAPFSVRNVHTEGKLVYLHYGIPNYCYRWCMEDGVEYGWSVEKLKLMMLCSLLNGEAVAAQRFANMLKKTDFHSSWAKRHEQYVRNPLLMAGDPALAGILPLLRQDNFLTADQSQLELFLVEQLLSTQGDTPEQRELANFTMFYYRNNRQKLAEQ